MPRLTALGLYGPEHMHKWGRQFDDLEDCFKMGERVKSTIQNLQSAINCGKPRGVANNHTLPNTFVKHYYAPQEFIYTKRADDSESWRRISIDKVVTRRDFYTLTHSDGTDSITLERFFKNIEDHLPKCLSDMHINPVTRGPIEYWLSWFIATQAQRTPYAADIRKNWETSTPVNMPTAALVAANLTEAYELAKSIFSMHWRFWSLESYQTEEEVLLGETCVFRSPDARGLLCSIKRNTILQCSRNRGTQSEVIEHDSIENELEMIRNLNAVTITENAKHNGYVYRGSEPGPF
jgi:hypothetical protein